MNPTSVCKNTSNIQLPTTDPLPTTITTQHKNATSYANITSSTSFPKKEQAIILNSIDGITLREYIIALSNIISSTSIRYISRISNGRICIYLDSKTTADKLIDEKRTLIIQNNVIEIKPLITRNKRIVLSNVCPVIPNYIIEQKFQELKINILSPITCMKIGMTDSGFSHILSFRRQMYISPDDEKRIPESIQLTFEETNYWIYISTDTLKCFTCNNTGHIAKNCSQNKITPENSINLPQHPTQISQEVEAMDLINEAFNRNDNFIQDHSPKPTKIQEFTEPSPLNLKGLKRMHSPTASESSKINNNEKAENRIITEIESDESSSNFSTEDNEKKTKSKKKLKKIDPKTEEEVWRDIGNIFSELNKETPFPISLDQFISLIDNTRGKQNITDLVLSYTDNIKDLITMCNELHCKMNKSLKNRCSRLSRKLYEILNASSVTTNT